MMGEAKCSCKATLVSVRPTAEMAACAPTPKPKRKRATHGTIRSESKKIELICLSGSK